MTKFSIEYNPYLVECIFKENGRVLNEKNSKIGSKSDTRLQALLGKGPNWNGLLEEIVAMCDDNEVEISFKGRKMDFDDLKYATDKYTGESKLHLQFEETSNEADILKELDTIFEEIKESDIPEFKRKNEDGKDIFDAYEEIKRGIFEVNVIATMSSGKSTLINSLLHTELLPSKNQACTATIAEILDNDEMEEFEAECYDKNDQYIEKYGRKVVGAEDLRTYNADEEVRTICIEGNIPAVSSNKIKLCLKDTPGPNNSRNKNHERLTRSMIKETNAVVLYVINATQLGIDDDKELLKEISSEMKKTGKQSKDRFIFVINKCDALDEEKGETVDSILDEVREYLKGFDIIDPILIPTSAQMALVIRKEQKGEKLSRKERSDLGTVDDWIETEYLHYEQYATLTPSVRDYLEKKVEEYHKDEEQWELEALIHTGVPAVEQTISEYVDKYAYPMKIKDSVKEIIVLLDELNMKGSFDKLIAGDEKKLEKVRNQITEALIKHDSSKSVYETYKKELINFSLDSTCDDQQYIVEQELSQMVKKYDRVKWVNRVEADRLINEFQGKLEKYQRECESAINRQIEEEIFKKCTEQLEEYRYVIRTILEDIEIDGYDFEKLDSFQKIKINNIGDIKSKNTRQHYKEETRKKNNPEREGFLGHFKFWEPREISYTVSVKDGEEINVKQVSVDIMNAFTESIKDNIAKLFAEANKQVSSYKNIFVKNIDSLNNEITKILNELDEQTKTEESIKLRVDNNKEMLCWVMTMEEKIRTLLEF